MVWSKRGAKLSSKVQVAYNKEDPSSTTLIIPNFNKNDLGVYICKAKTMDASSIDFVIKGESHFYLMASDFGYDPQDQIVYGPDITVKGFCNQESNMCDKPLRSGDSVLLTCSLDNFDTNYPEMVVNYLVWKKADGSLLNDNLYRVQKIDQSQISIYIYNLGEQHAGAYGCFAYTSAGTFMKQFEIKPADDDDDAGFKLTIPKNSKKINLSIQEHDPLNREDTRPVFNSHYEFDCISGNVFRTLETQIFPESFRFLTIS